MNSTFTTAMDGSVQPFAAAWGCRVARVGLMLLVLVGWAITSAYAAPDDNDDKVPRLAVKSTSEAPLTLNYTATPAECSECKGGLISLTLLYNGAGGTLVVTAVKKGKKGKEDVITLVKEQVVFEGMDNEVMLLGQNGGTDKFPANELTFTVDGVVVAVFHVSCSSEIGPGTTEASGGKHEDPNRPYTE